MKKLAIFSLAGASLAVAGLLLVPNLVSAQRNGFGDGTQAGAGYGYRQNLENKAQVLGLSVEDLQAQLQTKTLAQVIEEQGKTLEEFRAAMSELAEARWAEMGLSQEEIAERQAERAQRQAEHNGECDGTGGGLHKYGQNR